MPTRPEKQLTLLPDCPSPNFPPTELALDDPNGLLAISLEDITVEWMLAAYSRGIFPWSSDDDMPSWWTPNPRAVLFTDQIKFSKSLQKTWRSGKFNIRFDTAFEQVIQACATITRPGQDGTWLRQDIKACLQQLHQQGYAHSVEVWLDNKLVGGLYGLSIGQMFFGESMFSYMPDTSKLALVALAKQLQAWGWPMIDCQMETNHLKSMGATTLTRKEFEHILHQQVALASNVKTWQFDQELMKTNATIKD